MEKRMIRDFCCFRFTVRSCLHDVGPGCSPACAKGVWIWGAADNLHCIRMSLAFETSLHNIV